MDLWEQVNLSSPMVDGVRLRIPAGGGFGEYLEGTLCLTAFHFIYSTRRKAEDELTFLHTSIATIERRPPTNGNTLFILLKDFRRFLLEFKSVDECFDFANALDILSKPESFHQLHAIFGQRRDPSAAPVLMEDIHGLMARWQCPSDKWRVSIVNNDFKVCATYSEKVIVPTSFSDQVIKTIAGYRQEGRFPVLSYYNSSNKAALLRSSQPLVGPGQKRCREDVQFLNACLHSMAKGRVLDVRSQQQAHNHMSKGGGVELPSLYPQWRVEYSGLESPRHIHASLTKLLEVCVDPSLWSSSSWFGRVEASGWLTNVEKLMKVAQFVVHTLNKDGVSVLVHGRGGRDLTLQVTSLALILMDNHCRTMKGFLELIQREWLDAGHPFSLRHSHIAAAPEKESAPVFLLFLDAVWQVMQQFPLSFEFNERLLHLLFIHSYSSDFTVFLYDQPSEREQNKQLEGKNSLWGHFMSSAQQLSLLNPLYDKNPSVLHLTVHPCNMVLWRRLYVRTTLSLLPPHPSIEGMRVLKEENKALKRHLDSIRRELEELQSEGRHYSTVWR